MDQSAERTVSAVSKGQVTAIRGPSGKLRLPNVANERKTVEGRVTLTDADFEPCTPKKTARHFQSIADWGACRKTPVAAENHHLEAQESCRAMANCRRALAHLSYQLFAALAIPIRRAGRPLYPRPLHVTSYRYWR